MKTKLTNMIRKRIEKRKEKIKNLERLQRFIS